jgi:hypothetical protein
MVTPGISIPGFFCFVIIKHVYSLKLKIMSKFIVIDCYGDYYEVDNLEKFVSEWYGGEISLEEGMIKIYEDCEVIVR